MKKLIFIFAIILIAFASCEKTQDDITVQSQELLKKKPAGNNGNGNGNGNNTTTLNLLAINGDDTLVITPLSPIYVHVGQTILLTVTPDLDCSWANSNTAAAHFYVLGWDEIPFNFYGNECWLTGLSSDAPDDWGLITAGYTFPSGIRVNSTNYYYVLP